jgi:hypothetical protein
MTPLFPKNESAILFTTPAMIKGILTLLVTKRFVVLNTLPVGPDMELVLFKSTPIGLLVDPKS